MRCQETDIYMRSAWKWVKENLPTAVFIGTACATAIIWVSQVNASQEIVALHGTEINQIKTDLSDIKSDVKVIRESQRWIEKALGRRK